MRRAIAVVLGLCLGLAANEATAGGPLGASRALVLPPEAPYDLSNQTSLSEAERTRWLALFGRYADMCVALGLQTVRVGAEPPDLFSWGSIEPAPNTYHLLVADLFVEALVARGLEPVLPLSSRADWDHATTTRIPDDKNRYRDYVRLLVERYDGDLELGVPPGEEYPDITGDGSVSIADWGSTEAEKQAWATGHRVTWWEVGDRETPSAELGPLVQLTRPVMTEVSEEARLLLGGALAGGGKGAFKARVGSLDPKLVGEVLVDAVGLEVDSPGEGLATLAVMDDLRDTFGWLGEVGLGDVPVWLTSVGAGATPPEEGTTGPCGDPRCSERTQAAQLVKLIVQSLETVPVQVPGGFEDRRFERVLLREPIEHGQGGPDGDWTGGGLLTLAEGDPATAPMLVRPAWATVARLAVILSDLEPDAVKRTVTFPDTTTRRVYGIRTATGVTVTVAWYNWDLDLQGAPYDGRFLKVKVTGIEGQAARVTTLYPASIDEVTGGATVQAVLDEQLVPTAAGEVTIDVREDAVLVESADQAPPVEDAGSSDTSDASGDDAGPAEDVAPTPRAPGGDGCGAAGGGGSPWALFAGLLALLAAWSRAGFRSGRSRSRRG